LDGAVIYVRSILSVGIGYTRVELGYGSKRSINHGALEMAQIDKQRDGKTATEAETVLIIGMLVKSLQTDMPSIQRWNMIAEKSEHREVRSLPLGDFYS
jgi:hypothetical protein